jgi:hypothetical protein
MFASLAPPTVQLDVWQLCTSWVAAGFKPDDRLVNDKATAVLEHPHQPLMGASHAPGFLARCVDFVGRAFHRALEVGEVHAAKVLRRILDCSAGDPLPGIGGCNPSLLECVTLLGQRVKVVDQLAIGALDRLVFDGLELSVHSLIGRPGPVDQLGVSWNLGLDPT